ncbi:MAG: glycosyltransferase family 4 protein [Anaerolineales bacterium]
MRVGLIVYDGLEGRSGGYLYDRKLVQALRQAGHAVTVLAIPQRRYLPQLGDNLRSDLLGRVLAAHLDVLLEDELCHPSLVALNRKLQRSLPLPIVAIVHHLRSEEPHPNALKAVYRVVERAYLHTLDGLICNSRSTLRSVRALGGRSTPALISPPAADHLGTAVSQRPIAKRAYDRGPLQVLFLGNLIPRKGLHILLEAMARLPAGAARLTVAGDLQTDPNYVGRIRRRADRLGLDGSIRFVGPLSPRRVAAELRRSQVLAVPSSLEGFGIAYLEGMAHGLPALATSVGGGAEIVRDGYNGYLIRPGEIDVLADRLARLASDRKSLARMGQAARRTYLGHPTWGESTRRSILFLSRLAPLAEPIVSRTPPAASFSRRDR